MNVAENKYRRTHKEKGDGKDQTFIETVTTPAKAQPANDARLVLGVKVRRLGQVGSNDQIEIAISDTGVGIAEQTREHIFEPFFTTKPSGTGLGLAIVKRIITAHKGSIQVNSYPGATVFTVRFPAA